MDRGAEHGASFLDEEAERMLAGYADVATGDATEPARAGEARTKALARSVMDRMVCMVKSDEVRM